MCLLVQALMKQSSLSFSCFQISSLLGKQFLSDCKGELSKHQSYQIVDMCVCIEYIYCLAKSRELPLSSLEDPEKGLNDPVA